MFDRERSPQSQLSKIVVMISLGACLLVILWELNFGDAIGLSLIFFVSMIVAVGMISSTIIITHHGSSDGLIIAATTWVATGIGMSVGYSLYFIAIAATFIGYMVLKILDIKSDKL